MNKKISEQPAAEQRYIDDLKNTAETLKGQRKRDEGK